MSVPNAQVLEFPGAAAAEDHGRYEAATQKKEGYVQIPNSLFDALLGAGLGKREWAVMMTIIRKTLGFNKDADDISSSQIQDLTGIPSTHCRAAIRSLASRNMVLTSQGKYGTCIQVNTNPSEWEEAPDQNSPPRTKTVRGSDQNSPGVGPKQSGSPDQNSPHNKQPQQTIPNNKKGGEDATLISQAEEISDHLNTKAGKSFKARNPKGEPTKNAQFIIARLKEGYTVEECKAVVDSQSRAWKGDATMDRYLRPETLFRPSKFEGYLGEAQAKPQSCGPAGLKEF